MTKRSKASLLELLRWDSIDDLIGQLGIGNNAKLIACGADVDLCLPSASVRELGIHAATVPHDPDSRRSGQRVHASTA